MILSLSVPPGRFTGPIPERQPIPIDPAPLTEQEQHESAPVTAPATEIEDDDGGPDRMENGKRLTTAEKVVKNGLVEGAMRGNMLYSWS